MVKLNLEGLKDIVIIEYGQYLTEESQKYFDTVNPLFANTDCRIEYNKAKYYYINGDGVRITKIEKKNNNDLINKNFIISAICAGTATVYFGAAAPSILNRNFIENILNQVNIIKCGVNNKITLEELNHEFIGELWAAKNYVLTSHNCQDFAAEVIKILKAVRIKEEDVLTQADDTFRAIEEMYDSNLKIYGISEMNEDNIMAFFEESEELNIPKEKKEEAAK